MPLFTLNRVFLLSLLGLLAGLGLLFWLVFRGLENALLPVVSLPLARRQFIAVPPTEWLGIYAFDTK